METKITADVVSNWNRWRDEVAPRYRIYVDEELMTERDFIWNGNENYLREHIVVELAEGEHNIRLDLVHGATDIELKNIVVNNQLSSNDFVIPA
jgi:hypothetical protein